MIRRQNIIFHVHPNPLQSLGRHQRLFDNLPHANSTSGQLILAANMRFQLTLDGSATNPVSLLYLPKPAASWITEELFFFFCYEVGLPDVVFVSGQAERNTTRSPKEHSKGMGCIQLWIGQSPKVGLNGEVFCEIYLPGRIALPRPGAQCCRPSLHAPRATYLPNNLNLTGHRPPLQKQRYRVESDPTANLQAKITARCDVD